MLETKEKLRYKNQHFKYKWDYKTFHYFKIIKDKIQNCISKGKYEQIYEMIVNFIVSSSVNRQALVNHR